MRGVHEGEVGPGPEVGREPLGLAAQGLVGTGGEAEEGGQGGGVLRRVRRVGRGGACRPARVLGGVL
ncbi:hypothetical protein NKH77_47125 [Streptomyces sp. M19]